MKASKIFKHDMILKKVPPASPLTRRLKFPSDETRLKGKEREKKD